MYAEPSTDASIPSFVIGTAFYLAAIIRCYTVDCKGTEVAILNYAVFIAIKGFTKVLEPEKG